MVRLLSNRSQTFFAHHPLTSVTLKVSAEETQENSCFAHTKLLNDVILESGMPWKKGPVTGHLLHLWVVTELPTMVVLAPDLIKKTKQNNAKNKTLPL